MPSHSPSITPPTLGEGGELAFGKDLGLGSPLSPSSASSGPLSSSLSTSLPPSGLLFPAFVGGMFFLGSHISFRSHTSPLHSGGLPTRLRAPLRAGRLPRLSRLRPSWSPRAPLSPCGSQRQPPLASSPGASVARFLPHPHEIPGLIPPGRRPEVRGASRPAPHDSSQNLLNRP